MKFVSALLLISYFSQDISAQPVLEKSSGSRISYFVSEEMCNWNVAFTRCRSKGMHLVSIHSRDENEFIKHLVEGNNRGYWTSGNDLGQFYYIFSWMGSGKAVSFTNWRDEPSGVDSHCIAYLSDQRWLGQWLNTDCYTIKQYICEQRSSDCDASNFDILTNNV